MSVTSADKVIAFGPMVGLQWHDLGTNPPRKIWLERTLLDTIRQSLLPAIPPPGSPGGNQVTGGCWVWVGPLTYDGRPVLYHGQNAVPIRRLIYDLKNGPLTARDHLSPACGVGRCCNPDHMDQAQRGPIPKETLTRAQRMGYDTCAKGHALTPANTYILGSLKFCRTCRAENSRAYRAKGKGTPGTEKLGRPQRG